MGDEYYLNDDDLINEAIANAQDDDDVPPEEEYDEEEFMEDNNAPLPPHPEIEYGDGGEGGRGHHGDATATSNASAAGVPVPQRIVAMTSQSLNNNYLHNDNHHHHHHDNEEEELYKFERYTGLSSWRSSGPGSSKAAIAGGENQHGATTMEATTWKKKKEAVVTMKNKRHDEDEDEDEEDSIEGNNGGGGGDSINRSVGLFGGGIGGVGSQAQQLVHFREKEELILLGKSWGGRRSNNNINYANNIHKENANHHLPKLGEESMAMTLADGTRTFIKKRSTSVSGSMTTSSHHNKHPLPKEVGGQQSLLSLSMTELIRRADILQKRAIQRKIEREGTTTTITTKHTRDGCDADDDELVNEDGNVDDGKNNGSNADVAYESTENDAILNPTSFDDQPQKDDDEEQDDPTKKKVTFQLSQQQTTQSSASVQRKRQHHKLLQLQQRLWVDKHAPTSISHLLSDERTNREVLRALRAWDPYVFKKEAPVRPMPAYPFKYGQQQQHQQYGNDSKQKSGRNKGQGKNVANGDGDDTTFDGSNTPQRTDVRPDESSRVILLSGPPGVGKSTLAHIVCKHAGYHAIEVNASDERTASSLTERVTRAMESTTLDLGNFIGMNEDAAESKEVRKQKSASGGGGGKPNCIILDEIDGADAKSTISALVDIIRADIPSTTSKGKKGKGSGTYLRRPIILICNHKYAPALRPILPYARQFDVQPPNSERLTSRLRAVLAAERMSVVAGGMLLRRLVAGTGGDIRSCLYSLQFASARAREVAMKKQQQRGGDNTEALVVDISSALMATLGDGGNGMKDMQSDVSSTVATVFRKEKAPPARAAAAAAIVNQNKRQKTSNGTSSSGKGVDGSKGVDIVLKAVEHFGDNSKTLDCLFMNINRVSYVDPTLDRCYNAYEWLSGADMYRSLNSNVAMNNSAEHHSMQKFYIPTAAAAIHLLCCVETRPDLTFSTRPLSDCHYQNQANVSLVHRFMEGLAPMVRRGCGGGTDTVVSDVVPYGLWLLSAGDGKHSLSRQVTSVDLLSAEERLAFSAHVDTLRALGLTYVKEDRSFDYKNPYNAVENLRLEPEIDKLVKFEHMNDHSIGRIDIPALLKELLAHGATVAAMRERENEANSIALHSSARKQQPKKISLPTAESDKPPAITPVKPTAKSGPNTSAAKNFLGFRASKAKEAKTARRAATVGFDRSKKVKLSNTGSGNEISKVIRFKYQKGFTQAVKAPCQLEDLL